MAIKQRSAVPSQPPADVAHHIELLGSVGAVRARRMFGGWGFYVDGFFVALIFEGRLFLKTNTQTQARFEAAGCVPFVYRGDKKTVQMAYYTAPDDALDSPANMQPWAQLAVQAASQAALAAAAKHATKPKRMPRPAPTRKV